jgi:tRNA uridine 5-carbamoylmethylation protein Kti12
MRALPAVVPVSYADVMPENTVELRITRGLPGAGKTSYAREWVSEDLGNRARVNRDDLRGMLHAGVFVPDVTEQIIVSARDGMIRELLSNGISVICDDTNLPESSVADLRWLADALGAEFHVADLRWVPLDVCIERDAKRPRPVGESVIRGYHERHIAGKALAVAAALPASP